MSQYKYDFSVVMAVYNVQDYLREAVDSIVNQTIGFSHIQLILVDDGSTDSSGKICDEYKATYPNNVEVIHKVNGGQSDARNAGLSYADGRYLSFIDSDDIIDRNAFEKACAFMDLHETVDICCIPIVYFGEQTGNHILNKKFEKGERVADLSEEQDCILLHANSAFFRACNTRDILFDVRLRFAEDAKRIIQVLYNNPFIGIVTGTKYNYRKHGSSIIDGSQKNSNWYIPYMRYFSQWALDSAEEKYGVIPEWVQNTVMYDLQWRMHQSSIPDGVITESEKNEYRNLLIHTACRISDDIILNQKNLYVEEKVYLLSVKHNTNPTISNQDFEPKLQNNRESYYSDNGNANLKLCIKDKAIIDLSDMVTIWEFLEINTENNTCTVEGYHKICGLGEYQVQPLLLVNGVICTCEVVDRQKKVTRFLDQIIGQVIGFKASVPIDNDEISIIPCLLVDKTIVYRRKQRFGSFFPVSKAYKNSYAYIDTKWITVNESALCITRRPYFFTRLLRESKLLVEIWKKNRLGGRKAVAGRMFYHLMKPLKRDYLWIISDRIMKADDNGEALFRYLCMNHPRHTRVVFSVSKKSPDYKRMSKIGKCVDSMSFMHKLLHLLCDVNISSHAEGVTVNPFDGHHDALRDLLVHQRFVFLQHGITKDDLSDWLQRSNKNIYGFITAARMEQKSIQEGDYGYSPEKVWLTGFPRFDRLYRCEDNRITIMPSWRRYLMTSIDSKTGVWKIQNDWTQSLYFQFYNALLNSNYLLDSLDKLGFKLQFFPHPNLQPFMNMFDHDTRVFFLPRDTSYKDIYAQSNLVITDYSSAVFDFAYLRKPVLYCQFDKDQFFAGEHVYKQGYFDYDQDGFGEVAYDLDSIIKLIIEYASSGCNLKDKYRERIDHFFAFNDKNNCKRVTDKIISLCEQG